MVKTKKKRDSTLHSEKEIIAMTKGTKIIEKPKILKIVNLLPLSNTKKKRIKRIINKIKRKNANKYQITKAKMPKLR